MSGEAMVRLGKSDAFPVFSGSRLSENSDFSNIFASMLQNTYYISFFCTFIYVAIIPKLLRKGFYL